VAGFDREFDYLVPPGLASSVRTGSVVRIPLQGRKVRGWVTAYPAEPPDGIALRPLEKVSGWGPEPELVDLAVWAAWRWAGRRRSLLFTASALAAVRQVPAPATASAPPGAAPVRDLIGPALVPGTHILRLPPAASATDLVLAAAERGPVLVVAPTTSRAEAGCAALRGRGAQVALLPHDWAQARAGSRVVIGARAAAWGPCPGLAAVVVLDAHDEGLVQQQAPTWDAPTVAAERARRAGVACLWVSPCPTLEMLAGAADAVHLVPRSQERAGWAAIRVVNLRDEDPRSGLYSKPLVEALRHKERRVVCVLNRKGRAVVLDCSACREVATCEKCAAAVVMTGDQLVCRQCQATRPVVCRACGSDALRLLRPGVSRVREHLEALSGGPVGEVTASTGALPEAPVLVGTEAVLYRDAELRRSGGVGAIAFLDFDQEQLAPRYRAGEEALALLARASRLVGGRHGAVLVQTRAPSHPVIASALLADPGQLAAAEEPVRRALRLPPFAALAVLAGPGAAEMAASLEALAAAPPAAASTLAPGAAAPRSGAGDAPSPVVAEDAAMVPAVEVRPLAEGRWVVRAANYEDLADALAAAGRPAEPTRIEVGPHRL
jgi:primosomal protein N' (replication factor Y)